MKALTIIFICLTVIFALALGAYLVLTMAPDLVSFIPKTITDFVGTLPSWTLYAIAGATGLALILAIVFGIVSKKKPSKDAESEASEEAEEEKKDEEPKEETKEEAPAEETKEEPAEEVEEVHDEEVEEAHDEEIEEASEDAVSEEPAAEESQAEEEQAPQEEAKEEEPQEEEPQEEEKEEMVAEQNIEAKTSPAAAVEEVEEEAPKAEPAPTPKKEEVAPSIAAFITDQQKLNENIEKRLEGIDKSLKVIADALRAFLYDTVPAGVTTVSVSTKDAEAVEEVPTPVETSDVADGGNYFEQVEEDQKIEEQNAEIAENYAEGWIATADQDSRIKPKMSFEMRLRVADPDIKKFYTDIKNELLSYGIHDRISRHRENFNQGRINICRMVINGKTLKIYLAVDPESIDKRYFHHTDVGHRKGLVELPTMINVRSKVAARKVMELITLMMESLVISKKPYEPHDFAKDLTVDGFTTVECKGYDYLVEKSMTLDKAKEYPDNFAGQLIEMVEDNEYQERFIKTTLTLDDIAAKFKDGDVVDIDKVRELGLGPANSNFLSVKESKKISKKFKVYANEYTPDAVKMICLAGGEAFLVIQPEKTIEEV